MELTSDQAQDALQLARAHLQPRPEYLPRLCEQRVSCRREPTRHRRTVDTIEHAEAIDGDAVEDVLAQQNSVAIRQSIDRLAHCSAELRLIELAEVAQVRSGLHAESLDEVLLLDGGFALLAADEAHRFAHRDDAEPDAEAASSGEVCNSRRKVPGFAGSLSSTI